MSAAVNECLQTPAPCSPNATCTDLPTGFACDCKLGYSGNGLTCSDTPGCAGAPCYANVLCSDVLAPGNQRFRSNDDVEVYRRFKADGAMRTVGENLEISREQPIRQSND